MRVSALLNINKAEMPYNQPPDKILAVFY